MTFYCDVMLGRLALHLRMLGLDCRYSRCGSATVLLGRARAEHRIFLTRRTLYGHSGPAFLLLFIRSNNPAEQIREVLQSLRIRRQDTCPFSRCLTCNALLQRVDQSRVQDRVPDYVLATHKQFSECPECRKLYWQGTHYNSMLQRIDRFWTPDA